MEFPSHYLHRQPESSRCKEARVLNKTCESKASRQRTSTSVCSMTLRIKPLRFHIPVVCCSPERLKARTLKRCFPLAAGSQERRQRRQEYFPSSGSSCAVCQL